jgi:putative chitinase
MFENLSKVFKSNLFGEDSENNNFTPMNKKSFSFMKKTSDNFSVIEDIAKNIKESNNKIIQLVEIMGGQPKKDLSTEFFGEQKQKEEDIEASRLKAEKEKKPEKEEKFSIFKILKKIFETILKTITTVLAVALAPAVLIGIFVDSIKETFLELGKKIKDTLVETFDNFIEKIQTWINDTVKPIIDGVKEFIDNMVETVSTFFSKIGDWFVEKFETIKQIFQPALTFVKNVWDKFMSYIDEFKAFVKPLVEKAMNFKIVGTSITKIVKSLGIDKFLGIGQTPQVISKEEDDAEKKKLKRQQKEALDTERVRKQEEKAKYKGEDEIVRKRHKIEEKTTTMRAEEVKKAQAVQAPPAKVETKPEPTPIPKPTPTPTPSTPTAKEKKDEKPLEVSGVQATIIESLKQSGINSPKAHANVLATVKAESNFKVQSENLNYSSPDRIQGVFGKRRIPTVEFAQQFVKNPEALANHVYKTTDGNSEPGDGFKYRGRGFIQHTGKNQYAAISKFTKTDVLKNPDALNSPEVAAKAIPWFLLSYKKMKPEDVENMSKVNKAIAFADPTGQKALAREKSAEQIYSTMSGSPGTQVSSASSDVASGQRQQQKSSTPIVVNAPTTNTTVVNNKQGSSAPPPKDSSRALVSRAA